MPAINDNHKRPLLAGFRYIDEILTEAEARLSHAASAQLFPAYAADASPAQCRTVSDALARFRRIVRDFLAAQAIRDERPRVSALWALRTAVSFALSGLDELAPERLVGYGPLSSADAVAIARVLHELRAELLQLERDLERDGSGGDDAGRAMPADDHDAAPDSGAERLPELERDLATHGTEEFRAPRAKSPGDLAQAGVPVAKGRLALQQGRQKILALADRYHRPEEVASLLETTAIALADAGGRAHDAGGVLGAALAVKLDHLGDEFERILVAARQTLAETVAALGFPPGELPTLPARPAFDSASIIGEVIHTPGTLHLIGKRRRSAEARQRIADRLAALLSDALTHHVDALTRWALAQMATLLRCFNATAGTAGNAPQRTIIHPAPETLRADLERLDRPTANGPTRPQGDEPCSKS